MPNGNWEEKIDRILTACEKLEDGQKAQGETLAKLDERSQQHEKRMDRADKRAASIGGVTGTVGSAIVFFFNHLFGTSAS